MPKDDGPQSPSEDFAAEGLDPNNKVSTKKRKELATVFIKQEIATGVVAGTLTLTDAEKLKDIRREAAEKYDLTLNQVEYLYRNDIKQDIGQLMPVVPIVMQAITKTQSVIEKLDKDIETFDTEAKAAKEHEDKIAYYNLKIRAVGTLNATISNQVDTIKKIGGLELAKRKLDIAQDELNRRKGIFADKMDTDDLNYENMSKEDLEAQFKERLSTKKHLLTGKKQVDFIDYGKT